ncbi:MAG: hypothetical protein JOY78_20310 [Pseudonocardia sp.]|nr:hypothetical protein [Pseudonocardia sp.]
MITTTMIAAAIALSTAQSDQGTINLTAFDADTYPVCVAEDCSDQPGQVGMYEDPASGDWYLELGRIDDTPGHIRYLTLLVIDDTVRAS